MMQNGIDVANINGAIDWQQVKASGIDFVIIRAGLSLIHILFMLSPSSERMTRPMRLLPSPPSPLRIIMRCPLVLGMRQ